MAETYLTTEECSDHLDHAGEVCTGCKEPIDDYGNTAYDFKYCSFPNCGCNGARLCMAGKPNSGAMSFNIEIGSIKHG